MYFVYIKNLIRINDSTKTMKNISQVVEQTESSHEYVS